MADESAAEARFREVFVHFPEVVAYARRQGSRDSESVAAEALTIVAKKPATDTDAGAMRLRRASKDPARPAQ
jgi:hypothetical protein